MTPVIALEWVGVVAAALITLAVVLSIFASALKQVREARRPNPFKACTRRDHECGKAGAGPCNGLPRIDWSQQGRADSLYVAPVVADSLPKRGTARKVVIRPSDPEGN